MEKNLCLDEIVSIEKVGKKKTFDFNMPTGCFFANDFLVHNSRVCVVLSYNKDKGSYKVNVEKNAFGRTGEFNIKFEPEYSSFRELTEEEEYDIEMKKKISKRGGGLYGCQDSMLA